MSTGNSEEHVGHRGNRDRAGSAKKEGERLQRVPEMIQGTVQSGKCDIERRLILLVKSQV